jgi:MobA/MobL family
MSESGFYHCSVKPVGRANGRSVVAAAAYRRGERLADDRTGEVFDYRARGGVEDTFILTRDGAAAWGEDSGRLWNAAERAEPRANGRLATELELALPHELTDAQRKQLVVDFLAPIIARHGVAADVAIHASGEGRDHRNIHAHVLITHREFGPEGFEEIANRRTITKKVKGQEKQVEIAGIAATPADIKAIRKEWEQHVNRAYEREGLDIRVDCRSHEDRGIEQEPTKHLGPTAAAMERRGMESDRGAANREITQRNAARLLAAMLEAEASQIVVQIDGAFTAAGNRITEPVAPSFDRDQANRDWEQGIIDAANHAQENAREARQQPQRGAGAGIDQPTAHGPYAEFPTPQPAPPSPDPPLSRTAGEIHTAWSLSRTPEELDEAFAARGMTLAAVSADEARQSERAAAFAKEVGNYVPSFRAGEIVVVDKHGAITRMTERVTGDDHTEIEARLAGIDRRLGLLNVSDAQTAMREANREAWRDAERTWQDMERPLTSIERSIADALKSTMTGTDFAEALDKQGLTIARATEADQLAMQALRHDEQLEKLVADVNIEGRKTHHFATVLAGDWVAVTRGGDVFKLSPTAVSWEEVEQRLADTQTRMPSVVEVRAVQEIHRERTAEQWEKRRAENLAAREAFEAKKELRRDVATAERAVDQTFDTGASTLEQGMAATDSFLRGASKIVEMLGGILEFFAGGGPKLSPQQMRDELKAETNLETLHARSTAADEQKLTAETDERLFQANKQQQEDDLSFAAFYGMPPPPRETRNSDQSRSHLDDDDEPRRRRGHSL